MNPKAEANLQLLMEGNQRFRAGESTHYIYPPERLRELVVTKDPLAAIITCIDARVAPEVVFDQPLGSLFVSRVPGNVASDSAKWMLEIAVTNLQVPLVIVMGHTECLAVGQIVRGEPGSGGSLRDSVARAVDTAREQEPPDLFRQSVIENAVQTVHDLKAESWAVRSAMESGRTSIVSAIYDVHTGSVELIRDRVASAS